jgi:hypothetical protein
MFQRIISAKPKPFGSAAARSAAPRNHSIRQHFDSILLPISRSTSAKAAR